MRQQPDRCDEGGDVDALHQRFAQKVVRTTAGYRILSANLISFTPGFRFPITRLKPGVNENLNLRFV
jgi:hypothetical protein